MNFNDWCQEVGFGSTCDRKKHSQFIEKYENSRFISETNRLQKKCNNAYCLTNVQSITCDRCNLVQLTKSSERKD